MLFTRIIVSVLCCCSLVAAKKLVTCDFEDLKCMMVGVREEYKHVVSGSDTWKPSIPLLLDNLNISLPDLKYSIHKMSLSGIESCSPEYVKISITNKQYDYHLLCPHLVLKAEYDIKGTIISEYIEGQGTTKIDYYEHLFKFHGTYSKYDKDSKLHIHLEEYDLDIDVKGKVETEFENLLPGNEAKSAEVHHVLNENWKSANEIYGKPIIEAFMSEFFTNLNGYLKAVPVEKFTSYYE